MVSDAGPVGADPTLDISSLVRSEPLPPLSAPGAAASLPPEEEAATEPEPPSWAFWAGGNIDPQSWFSYSGLTWAPAGPILEDGWRLRAMLGTGAYEYDREVVRPGPGPGRPAIVEDVDFEGRPVVADLSAGYRASSGPWTASAYLGLQWTQHPIAPADPLNEVSGSRFGARLALETWRNVGDDGWLQFDASFETGFSAYAASLRGGWRVLDETSVGLELIARGDRASDGLLAGVVLRTLIEGQEVSASLGASQAVSFDAGALGEAGLYATISTHTRF
ncbi:MAG: cellulose biosynthesis protein BcsS [Rhizobiales bacterium]|nr:cellulose biosynthesis protein BcsS [Hyphomicrobiales bacterium]